ncbi:MAG TPA: DUF4418 family protein [Anaerolineae bacterium]|nr:DUF4418 family protein [Anaerolineae bacterium]HOQ98635.1 DUF4418 family protein [Anaerolineae bacterium]HPL28248.1 DUF4418 family protein [Anaerolineae bacterium]
MKCFWTARGKVALAAPLLGLALALSLSRRREAQRALALVGAALGLAIIALPTLLIGTCSMATASCNLVMKPSLILLGGLVTATSVAVLALVRAEAPQAAALTGLAVAVMLLVQGAEGSLQLARERLGADIIVVPEGTLARVESALVVGVPTRVWMPRDDLARIAAIPGVAAVSPQPYLSSLFGASCCSVSEMFLVAYDPDSDFSLRPWLQRNLSAGLGPARPSAAAMSSCPRARRPSGSTAPACR